MYTEKRNQNPAKFVILGLFLTIFFLWSFSAISFGKPNAIIPTPKINGVSNQERVAIAEYIGGEINKFFSPVDQATLRKAAKEAARSFPSEQATEDKLLKVIGKITHSDLILTIDIRVEKENWKLNIIKYDLKKNLQIPRKESCLHCNFNRMKKILSQSIYSLSSVRIDPPTVRIIAPMANTTVSTSEIEVRTVIQRGEDALEKVELYLNDKPVESSGKRSIKVTRRGGELTRSFLVKLEPGNNRIRIRAHNAYNFGEDRVTVIYKMEAGYPRSWYNKQYALIIGIDQYKNPNIPALRNAVNDATALAQFFQGSKFEVIELYNHEATRENIINAIRTIYKKAKKEDSFVFYFAGHGQGVTLESKDRVGYLIPYDTDFDLFSGSVIDFNEEAIPLNTLKQYAKDMKPKHIAILLDSCFSGLAMRSSAPRIKDANFDYYNDLLSRKAINLMTAGDDQPVNDGTGHSPFARALLSGLERKGVDIHDRDGFATFVELAVYVKQKVEQATNRRQRPQFDNLSADDGDFLFRMRKEAR